MSALTEFETSIQFDPGHDDRDDIGPDDDLQEGRALGLGIIFKVIGRAGVLSWGINTGWFHRPVLTDRLVRGPQQRAEKPGVDRAFRMSIEAFPNPLFPSAWTPTKSWNIEREDIRDSLMDALTSGGEKAVFEEMKAVFREHLG